MSAVRSESEAGGRTGYSSRERGRFAWAAVLAFLVLAAGVALTIRAYQSRRAMNRAEVASMYRALAQDRLNHLGRELESQTMLVRALGAFYASSTRVEEEEFRRFVEPFRERLDGLAAVLWAPGQGPAWARRFPVAYAISAADASLGAELEGEDIYALPDLAETLSRACSDGVARASAVISWPAISTESPVVVMAAPVFEGGAVPDMLQARQAKLRGFVAGVYEPGRVLSRTASHSVLGVDLVVEVRDLSSGGRPRVMYSAGEEIVNPAVAAAQGVLLEKRIAEFGGRRWELRCLAARAFMDNWPDSNPVLVLVGGLLISGLLAAHFFVQVSGSARTEREVRERTVELHRANESLEREVAVRHAVEQTLRESRRTLSTLLSNLPGMAYRCRNEPSWRMEFVSEGCGALTGYEPPELINNQQLAYADLIVEEDRAMVWSEIQQAVEHGRAFQLLYRIRRRDGEVRWMWEQGRGVYTEDDRALALEGFITDIDPQVRAQQELERLNLALQEKNRELEVLLYATSHDLRSPLVSIRGFGRELEKACGQLRERLAGGVMETEELSGLLDEEIPEALKYIGAGVDKMDSLLKGLLQLSRLGRVDLNVDLLDVGALVHGLVDGLRHQREQRGAEMAVGDLPSCYGDATQVSRVFSNLLDNALKYLDRGRPGRIEVTGEAQGEMVEYRVRDNGVGIASEYHEGVFELCRRLDGEQEGEGLGLTIAQRIVQRHNGSMWLESASGEGSTFHFTLPNQPFVPDRPFSPTG